MHVGIIGTGGIGMALATQLARARIDTGISNSRGRASLVATASALGPSVAAVDAVDAARARIVIVAVPWERVPGALEGLGPWDQRIVIDSTNPVELPDFRVADLGGRTSSEIVAGFVPGARVVKAFNTLTPETLAADPHHHGGRRVIFMSGDDPAANAEVSRLVEALGFAPIELGGLIEGGRLHQFPTGPLPAHNLIKLS